MSEASTPMSSVMDFTDSEESEFYVSFIKPSNSPSFIVASENGYKLINLKTENELQVLYSSDEDVLIIEPWPGTSIVALVHACKPYTLTFKDFKTSEFKGDVYKFKKNIISLKINFDRIVVLFKNEIRVCNSKNMEMIHHIKDTPDNKVGLMTLSLTSSPHNYLAYPSSEFTGMVTIVNLSNPKCFTSTVTIAAHEGVLAALAFSQDGTKLATASQKGTLIRLFNSSDGTKLNEFRRGLARVAMISCLSFDDDGQYLCCSSNTETIHIFKVDSEEEPNNSSGWMSMLGSAYKYVSSTVYENRSSYTINLPFSNVRTICTVAKVQNVPRVLVTTTHGDLLVYQLDPSGYCKLVKEHKYDVC